MSERDEIEETARPAVLVRRTDLPVPLAHPARSFFGGLPRLPSQLDWPMAEVTADTTPATVALTFVAQIDLAEVPGAGHSPLPARGTLYFFCSSVFVGEAYPPCRVLYSPTDGDANADRAPPPELMPLAGTSDRQVKWLNPDLELHAKVEFKYPLSFLPFRDFYFCEDPVGGELMVEELCNVLGPGEPKTRDLFIFRNEGGWKKDEDWPFNWLLINHVVRSILVRLQEDLSSRADGKRLSGEAASELERLQAGAIRWLEQGRTLSPMEEAGQEIKVAFRSWWFDVVQTYGKLKGQVYTYPSQIPEDIGHAIHHTVRCMAAQEVADHAPSSYVANLASLNHWKAPAMSDGEHRSFDTALHQMLGYGSSPQDATEVHLEDVLLLQVQADHAFFDWHSDIGCSLQFWIDRDSLDQRDFSQAVATLECG